MLSAAWVVPASESLALTGVQLVGTTRLTTVDLMRGLDLKPARAITRQDLRLACNQFRHLKLFESSHCNYHVLGHSASMTIFVKDRGGLPVVFDNFVWETREELLARLKQGLPLFMRDLPPSSGLTNEIIGLLEQVAAEHGIKARVRYDDSFWTARGMNVFFIDGISTPVDSLQIEGENGPAPVEFQKWAQRYAKENFSAARLTWVIGWVIREFYFSRGYMRPVVGNPIVQCFIEKDGTFPVRIVLPISSGDLYRFASLKFEGLAKERTASLLPTWKLSPGDPYDQTYVRRFIFDEVLSAPWARYSKDESDSASWCDKIGEASKTISVSIHVDVPKRNYPAIKEDQKCGGHVKILTFHPIP